MSKPTDPMDPPDPADVPDPSSAPYIPRLVDPAPYDPDTPRPATAAQAPVEDPATMARRLAAEAKARVAAAAPKEDPVALAKRLASEAKRKVAAAAPKEDPVVLAKRLAAEAKKKMKKAAKAPKPAAPAGQDLMSRMSQPRKKTRSAADILAEARQTEAETPIMAPTTSASPPAAAPPPPAPKPAPAGPNPAKAVLAVLRNATLREVKPVSAGPAFKAVWNAHLARAQATEDIALAVSAAAVLAAVERVGPQGLSAAEVRWGGQSHAVFVESHSGTIIATAYPAGVYLAGA